MSKQFLERVLQKHIDAFEKTNEEFRTISNTKAHRFTASEQIFIDEIQEQLASNTTRDKKFKKKYIREKYSNKKVNQIVAAGAKEMYEAVLKYAKGQEKQGKALVEIEGDTAYITYYKDNGKDVFAAIRRSYYKPKANLINKLNNYFKRRRDDLIDGYGFVDLGHKGDSAISSQRREETFDELRKSIIAENKKLNKPFTDKELAILKLDFSLFKKDTLSESTYELGIEATTRNKKEGAGPLQKASNQLKKDLENALVIASKGDISGIKGSDSRLEIEEKKILGSFEDNIKEGKNLKKLTKNKTKPNLGKTKVSKKKKVKAKRGRRATGKVGPLKLAKKTSGTSGTSNISLLALLNAKITETVSKNMGKPALVYRTGRFARSVKISDIAFTAKGYPSIGYSYENTEEKPYGTFENAAKWGAQRDPRKLIDKSIREIAAELTIGRFYTRRLFNGG